MCFQFGRASRAMARVYREKLSSLGITHIQFFILIALYESEGIPVSELSEKVTLDKSTMTGLLDRLERENLIKRVRDRQDRRIYRVFLTERSRALKDKLMGIYREVNGMFLSKLSPEDLKTIKGITSKIENIAKGGGG